MAPRAPDFTASDPERPRIPSNAPSRSPALRNLTAATAFACFALLQGSDPVSRTHPSVPAAAETAEIAREASTDMERLESGESLMGRLLHVTVDTREGPREIAFRVARDGNELVLCVENSVFRSGDSIMGIGKVSEQITDVTAEGGCLRLHSDSYGHADIRRADARGIMLLLGSVPHSQEQVEVWADVNYVPAEGSGIGAAKAVYQSFSGMFGAPAAAQSAHKVTFRRDRPVQIVQNDR